MSKMMKSLVSIMASAVFISLAVNAAPSASGAEDTDIARITKQVYPSVVRVEARNGTRKVATGVVIDKDGYIVTTALISPRDEKIRITTGEGKKSEAEFLAFDSETHLALLKTKEKGLIPIGFGKAADLVSGSWIGVVGISPENQPAVTQGIVSSITEDSLRLNVWVTPGSSGSPVVNDKGELVGLLRGVYTEDAPVVIQFRDKAQVGQGFAFSKAEAPSSGMAKAIPVEVIKSVTAQIREKGKVERGWLGVSISQDEEGRVEVLDVENQSPAEMAKIKQGDIILKIDQKEVTSPEVLTSEIRKRKPGQDITLQAERDGKPLEFKIRLGEYSAADAQKELELRFPRLFRRERPNLRQDKPGQLQPAPQAPRLKPFQWNLEKRRYIGLTLEELNRELSEFFGLKDGNGLLVAQLTAGSPAQKSGLKVGDVIFRADGKSVQTINALIDIVQAKKKGDKIKVEFLRERKPMNVDVTVEEEEFEQNFSFENWPEAFGSRQDYENLRQLMRNWQNDLGEAGQDVKQNMKKLIDELDKAGKDTAKGLKTAIKRWSQKV